jgi:hypothetical protein
MECYVERRIDKPEGGYKTPDLLVHSHNFVIVDHKYTESRNQMTLTGKIEEMTGYDTAFIWIRSGSEIVFEPEIAMLTPQVVAVEFKKILGCPIIWGYQLNDEITIEQTIGSVKDEEISSVFDPILHVSKSRDVAKYRFIISHAPLPYTACQIYTLLWTLLPTTQYFKPEFEVDYDVLLEQFNHLFPPWISAEVKQMNVTRLEEAVGFLESVAWIKWFSTEKKIIVYKGKGRLSPDMLEYFIDHLVKKEHAKRVREYEKQIEKIVKEEPVKQKRIVEYI